MSFKDLTAALKPAMYGALRCQKWAFRAFQPRSKKGLGTFRCIVKLTLSFLSFDCSLFYQGKNPSN